METARNRCLIGLGIDRFDHKKVSARTHEVISIVMSQEQLKAFLKKVESDPLLQDKLQRVVEPKQIVRIAQDHGFRITEKEERHFALENWRDLPL